MRTGTGDAMRILLWHLHGSWTTNFVQGGHEYFLPYLPERTAYGMGRGSGQSWIWPDNVHELPPDELAELDFDIALLQRPEEVRLAETWTRRRPGRDVPAVYLEHNTPGGNVPYTAHPLASQNAIPIVHVTHFNELIWDNGIAATTVLTDGVVDPGYQYTGTMSRIGVAINDPLRRGRAVGADLIDRFVDLAPVDLFGLQSDLFVPPHSDKHDQRVTPYNLSQREMHTALSQRRVYLHPYRWNAIGLSLMEAMLLGMPVVALGIGEIPHVLEGSAGLVSSLSIATLRSRTIDLLHDQDLACEYSKKARAVALEKFSLTAFHQRWDKYLSTLVN
jgi:hypothetical protein